MAKAQIRFGVKAGANITDLSTESSIVDKVKGAASYQVGVLLQAKLLGLAIQPEVLYSVKSSTITNAAISGVSSIADMYYESQNIEVPINLQYGLDLGLARAYIQAGPYFSFLASALVNGSKDEFENNWKDKISTFDYGVGLGVGLEVLGIQVSCKYDWGLGKLGDEINVAGIQTNPFNDLKYKNLSISLAYLF
jgi:hypothetical protein